MAKIANVALTNTFNTWRTNSNQAFDRLSQFAINNSSLYANTLTANTAFTSKGTTNLGDGTGDLTTITGRTTIGTNLTVSGNTSTNKLTVTNSLTSSGNTSLGDGISDITTITGTASVSKNLTVSGNTAISGLLANGALGTSDFALKTNGTSVFWGIALSNTFTTTVTTKSLIPAANITHNLGSTTKRYKDIFLANSTIHLGSAQISASGNKVLFNNVAAVSNSFLTATFATKATERAALANTNASISNVKTGLTSTNTALRLLISDRLQVANASTLYATKSNPTTSGLLAHTGRSTISTNLAVSGNTTISGLIANSSLGSANFLLKSSGTGTFWAAAAAGGGLLGMTAVTATGTFTIPAGVSKLKVTIVGGGGGGGGGAAGVEYVSATFYGAGGGGGGTAIQFISSVTPGNTITVTVGSGGAGGGSGSGGTTGGTSSIASGTESITSVSATGGAGGVRSSTLNTMSGGLGGLGSGGVLSLRGGGGTVKGYEQHGQGGSSMFGGGPPQVGTSVGVPSSSLYGVGGTGFGSGSSGSGAAGTAGLVLFEY